MTEQHLKEIFAKTLDLPIEEIVDTLEYRSMKNWDSIGHMALVAALDQELNVMLDTPDIIDMSSFKKAKEILNKYGVNCL